MIAKAQLRAYTGCEKNLGVGNQIYSVVVALAYA